MYIYDSTGNNSNNVVILIIKNLPFRYKLLPNQYHYEVYLLTSPHFSGVCIYEKRNENSYFHVMS